MTIRKKNLLFFKNLKKWNFSEKKVFSIFSKNFKNLIFHQKIKKKFFFFCFFIFQKILYQNSFFLNLKKFLKISKKGQKALSLQTCSVATSTPIFQCFPASLHFKTHYFYICSIATHVPNSYSFLSSPHLFYLKFKIQICVLKNDGRVIPKSTDILANEQFRTVSSRSEL